MDHAEMLNRNKLNGWGCKCHGMTFCPDKVCVGYENDVPVYVDRNSPEGRKAEQSR
jgi:Rieske Fe-S protein